MAARYGRQTEKQKEEMSNDTGTTCDSSFPLHRAFGCVLVLFARAALFSTAAAGDEPDYSGDVTDVRTIRRVEQHPQAWRVWQPVIIQGPKKNQLLVAFGAMRNGKKDMGDIFVSLSEDDGDTWEEPVAVFDHTRRQGAIQFAYANPVLCRVPGQEVIWCFAMRCSIAQRNSEESQLVAAFSADGGRLSLRYKVKPPGGDWSDEKTFYHAGIKNSYPTLYEVAAGDFRCVCDSGTPDRPRTHIHFGKLRITP